MLKLSQLFVALGIAAASGLTFGFVSSKADPQARYNATLQRVDAQFQKSQARCQTLPKDQLHLCMALAFSEKWRTLADAQVKLKDTPDARRTQRVINAGGDLLVSLQKCAVNAPANRDACRSSAKDAFMRELSRLRVMEAQEQPCSPAQCALAPERAPRARLRSV
jgi:hypothetical protein